MSGYRIHDVISSPATWARLVQLMCRGRRRQNEEPLSARIAGVGQLVVAALTIAACAPTLPPAIAPPQPNPAFDPFRVVLQAYVDHTQAFRKQAAEAAEKVPGKAGTTTGAETSVRTRQNDLAEALRTTLRPHAQ